MLNNKKTEPNFNKQKLRFDYFLFAQIEDFEEQIFSMIEKKFGVINDLQFDNLMDIIGYNFNSKGNKISAQYKNFVDEMLVTIEKIVNEFEL